MPDHAGGNVGWAAYPDGVPGGFERGLYVMRVAIPYEHDLLGRNANLLSDHFKDFGEGFAAAHFAFDINVLEIMRDAEGGYFLALHVGGAISDKAEGEALFEFF